MIWIITDKQLSAEFQKVRSEIRQLAALVQATRADVKHLGDLMAMTKSDLDNALAEITSTIQTVGNDLATTLADMEAKIAAGNPDLAPEVQTLKDATAKLQAFDATLLAADPGAPAAPAS